MPSSGISLAVPLSQNTAEVREFRCLFTHDVRRKAKRWQDGYLSFHTFNNRAVVFDESRNRVGDTYIQSGGDEVCEGLELFLQQGALVEVGEPHGVREQDVSQVIVARDTPRKQAGHVVYPQAPPTQRTISTQRPGESTTSTAATRPVPSQAPFAPQTPLAPGLYAKPKTLKEVLNAPSGSMGRARITNKSPYEQRHQKQMAGLHAMAQPVQICNLAPQAPETTRPSKRQKISAREETRARTSLPAQKTPEPVPQVQKTPSTTTTTLQQQSTPSRSQQGTRPASPILLESDGESTQHSILTITPMTTRIASPSKSNMLPPQTPSEGTARPSKDEAPRANKRNKDAPPKTKKRNDDKPKSKSAPKSAQKSELRPKPTEAPPAPKPLQERPANTLRLSSTGRRRKLMYRELLPDGFVPRETKSQSKSLQVKETSTTESLANGDRILPKAKKRRSSRTALVEDIDDDAIEALLEREKTQPTSHTDPAPRPSNQVEEEDSLLDGLENIDEMDLDVHLPIVADHDAGHAAEHQDAGGDIPKSGPSPSEAAPKPPAEDDLVAMMSTKDVFEEFASPSEEPPPLADRDRAIVAAQRLSTTSRPNVGKTTTTTGATMPPPRPPVPPLLGRRVPATTTGVGIAATASAAPGSVHAPFAPPRAALKRVTSAPAPPPSRPAPRALTKSLSETAATKTTAPAAAAQTGGRTLAVPPPQSMDDGRGPWSKGEAFDLFGWKPGMKKGVGDTAVETEATG